MADTRDDLSVVIPVYNSGAIIGELHKQLTSVLSSLTDDYEIIFVNDCSLDNSWEILIQLAASDVHITAISLRKNVGYDNAIMSGLRSVSCSYVVIMDDDLQHAPQDISCLLSEIKKGYDIVYANFLKKQQSFLKNIGSWLNGKLAQLIINKPREIYLSPFKIIRREIIQEIIKYDGPFPYIDGLLLQITSSVHQVAITHHSRTSGKGGHGLYRSLRIMMNFCTTFSILPLRIFTFLGFAISLIACIVSITLVVAEVWIDIDVEGWTSIMLGIIIFGGIQLIGMGILGEYVGRTYMNINRKPQYVVKEMIVNTTQPVCDPKSVD